MPGKKPKISQKQVPLSKLLLGLLMVFFLLLIIIFFTRLISGNEDNWICQNNTWVKHGFPRRPPPETTCGKMLIGGDRDEHGCIGSAGYSWCQKKEKCLRIWEESCE